jgi:lysophospholipase L1-like esterase
VAFLAVAPSVALARALPPAAAFALKDTFDSVRACRVEAIGIDGSTATVRLCLRVQEDMCFSLTLDDPQPRCGGEPMGPWCVQWTAGDPSDEIRDAIRTALRDSTNTWVDPEYAGRAARWGETSETVTLPPPRWRTLVLAFLLTAGPLLAGGVVGRRIRSLRRWWMPAVLALVLASAALALACLPGIGIWDVVSLAVLCIAGLLLGFTASDRRVALLFIVSSAIAFAGLEWATREFLPAPPRFPPPEDATFVLGPGSWDGGCMALYRPAGKRSGHFRDAASTGAVVHLGDSLTFGSGVGETEAFPALLDARATGTRHVNFGVWAVGTDFEYLLMEKILAEQTPAMVVLHVYAGNDISDIDRPYECCDGGPLLTYETGVPMARCSTPRWGISLASRAGRSPPPFPLRVATAYSYAARHAAARFSRLVFRFDAPPNFIGAEGEASEEGWEHFTAILARMRDELRRRGIPFVVDILPSRWALDSTIPAEAPSYRSGRRIAAIAADLGIRTLDPWDVLRAAVQRDGSSRYFLGDSDIHFTPEGHRLMANWLAEHLPPPSP